MTADAALVLALCGRSVGHTATLYGFDPNDPAEKLFALSVINVGSAMTQGAKYTALADLSKLTQALARSAPWTKLNEYVLAKVATKFAEQFSVRLTKQKLGQVVPFVGIAVGSAFDYHSVTRVQEAAYWAYRERFLLEKDPTVAPDLDTLLGALDVATAEAEVEPTISVEQLISEAEAEPEESDAEAGESMRNFRSDNAAPA